MRNSKHFRLLAAISVFVVGGCQCEPEPIARLAPLLNVGDPLLEDFSICTANSENENLFDTNCAYNFGDVPVGEGRFLKIALSNPTAVKMTIESMTIEGDGAFSIEPDAIRGDGEFDVEPENSLNGSEEVDPVVVTLRYAPTLASGQTGKLIIISNAVNPGLEPVDPDNVESNTILEIDLSGNGLDTGRPEIRVEPAECDFGDVGLNVTAFCDVSIHNDGVKDLQILSTAWENDALWGFEKVFFSDTILALPAFVAPGTAMSIRFTATPDSAQVLRNEFYLTSNDPLVPESTVLLKVTGAEAPTAVAKVDTINAIPNTAASPSVQPLDDVVLTGVDSVPSRVNGSIVAYEWDITEAPNESSATLSTPQAMTTGFRFDSAQGVVSGLDVAGTYRIRLTVTDDDGLVSTNDASVTLNAIPQEALHIQVTWDSPGDDLDTHVVKDNGTFCEPESCYYGNCKPTQGSGYPEWDGVNGRSAGDPVLDIDDLDGFGPENVNIDAPSDGTYRVGIHNYSIAAPTGATCKIYVNGALVYENYREMFDVDDMWEVAEVVWSNGSATVFPVNIYSDESESCSSSFF